MADAEPFTIAYVAVGSNVRPRENLLAAAELLRGQVEVTGVSTFYRTAALGPPGGEGDAGPDFLNGVLAVRTARRPRALKFDVLRAIERRLGRIRPAERYAPRTIDLDLVLYGEEVIDEPDLKIPAADVDRPFVAVPLMELAGDLVLPHTRQVLSCLWPGPAPAGMTPEPECTRALREVLTP